MVRWNTNVAIPTNGSSLYVNCDWNSHAYGSNGPNVTGWDFALYCADIQAASLEGTCANLCAFMKAPGAGGLYFGNLPGGTSIGGTGSLFTSGNGVPWTAYFSGSGLQSPGLWNLNSQNFFGFRFRADDGLQHYGYGCIQVGASTANRTLLWIDVESTPNQPLTVVPAPGAVGLAALAGLRGRRRRA